MKVNLRRINIDKEDFLWNISVDEDAANGDYILLKVWIPGRKQHPWIIVRYKYNNPWLFYGEIISATTSEEQKRIKDNFQMDPLKPRKVAEIIHSAKELLGETEFLHSFNKKTFLHMSDDGKLIV